jgi:phage-related protein
VSRWTVEFYQSQNGNSPILDWFNEQEAKVQAKLARIFELLEEHGTAVGKPYVAPLEDKLYEIRAEQDTNIYRAIYFAYTGKRFILLHAFQKKTQKTPKKEIELAKQRMKTFLAGEKPKMPPPEEQEEGKKLKKSKKK